MSSASTYLKLGVFTIVGGLAVLAVVFALGLRGLRTDSVQYHTYFDESVQGLEIGSPVKYRGVSIGTVSGVAIAPNNKHVDVTLAIRLGESRRLGLGAIGPDVRAQLSTQGITGVKLVDIDFFDPRTSPPPALPFVPAENTIPTKTSTMKGLEDGAELTLQRLPALLDATIATLEKTGRILDDFQGARIPGRLGAAIDGVGGAVSELRALLRHVDRAKIPDKTALALDSLNESVGKVNGMLDRMGGDGGLLTSTQRATDNLGDLGRAGTGSARELDRTLRDLDEAAGAIRDLAEAIERDPDMLVKGHAKEVVR